MSVIRHISKRRNQYFYCSLLSIAIIVSSVLPGASASQDGGRPGEFLRYGVGCRALAMGRAFVSVADDGSAIYWNPAGLIGIENKELTSMYSDLFFDSRYTYFAIALPRIRSDIDNPLFDFLFGRESAWGFGWVNLSAGDFMQYGDDHDWIDRNYFDFDEHALFFTFSREMVNSWGIFDYGTNLKFIKQGFSGLVGEYRDDEHDWSAGLDFGMKMQFINMRLMKWLSLKHLLPLKVGFNIQNLIRPTIDFGGSKNEDVFPTVFRWGLSYGIDINEWRILPVFDMEHCSQFEDGIYGGIEIMPGIDDLFIRFGFNNKIDKFGCGIGLNIDIRNDTRLKFDYAFGYHPNVDLRNFGGDHRVSMTIAFGDKYDSDYFHETGTSAIDFTEIRNACLQVLGYYPNDKMIPAAQNLADDYDTINAGRYWDLIGGIGNAERAFKEAKKALKNGKRKQARNFAGKAVNAYEEDFESVKAEGSGTLLNYIEALMIAEKWEKAVIVSEDNRIASQRYYYQLGISYKETSNWSKAVQEFNKAIKYDEDEKSMKALSYLGIGECQSAVGDYDHAIKSLDIVIQEYSGSLDADYPRYPIFYDSFIVDDAQFIAGKCYYDLGDIDEALNSFAKIPRFYPLSDRAKDGSADKEINRLIEEIEDNKK